MVYGKVIGVNIMFHVSIEPWVANKHTISVSGSINNIFGILRFIQYQGTDKTQTTLNVNLDHAVHSWC